MTLYKCIVIIVAITAATIIAVAALASDQDGYTVKTALGIIVLCLSAVGVQQGLSTIKSSQLVKKAKKKAADALSKE